MSFREQVVVALLYNTLLNYKFTIRDSNKLNMQAEAAANSSSATEPEVDTQPRDIDLFGGALVATLPGNMRDISDFVPVPDN